jgi:hypothetical protein
MNKIAIFFIMALCLIGSVSAANMVVDSNTSMEFYNTSLPGWQSAVQADKTNSAWDMITIPAQWIWRTLRVNPVEAVNGSTVLFRKEFDIPKCAAGITGSIDITADNSYNLSLNGAQVGYDSGYLPGGSDLGWQSVEHYNLTNLQPGTNTFTILARNIPQSGGNEYSNPAGVIYSANIEYDDSDCNDVPEFGVIAATIAMVGAIGGIILFRRH